MRRIKSLDEAQLVINELLDWKERVSTKNWDLHGLRISNAGEGKAPSDYATVSQIPIIDKTKELKDLNYTIVWSKDGIVTTDDIIPAFIVLKGREGIPHQLSIYSRVEGSISISLKSVDNLGNIRTLGNVSTSGGLVGISSIFSDPPPTVGYTHILYPEITEVSGAESVTVELIVRRFRVES